MAWVQPVFAHLQGRGTHHLQEAEPALTYSLGSALYSNERLIRVALIPTTSCKDGTVSLGAEGAVVAERGNRGSRGQAFR